MTTIPNIKITAKNYSHFRTELGNWRREATRAFKDKSYGIYQHYAERSFALEDKLDDFQWQHTPRS